MYSLFPFLSQKIRNGQIQFSHCCHVAKNPKFCSLWFETKQNWSSFLLFANAKNCLKSVVVMTGEICWNFDKTVGWRSYFVSKNIDSWIVTLYNFLEVASVPLLCGLFSFRGFLSGFSKISRPCNISQFVGVLFL